jgi:hypothetical protein|tara:strand:- start:974 stop:1204 length:231 start_codon:yes stop_codon:yes gene_type:complete
VKTLGSIGWCQTDILENHRHASSSNKALQLFEQSLQCKSNIQKHTPKATYEGTLYTGNTEGSNISALNPKIFIVNS